LGHEDQIYFWGKISRDEVMKKLKDAHVFVMISTNEIFGLSYLEAMAASCITIASRNGGVDGIIVNEHNGYLCEEGDSEELKRIIENIVFRNQKEICELVNNSYNTAAEYADSKVAALYLRNIVNGK
jgi:glycosyltransferase involved in cell wall biosynthesis